MIDNRVPMSQCPNCHKKIDAASNAFNEEKAQPGNITVCLYCGHVMAFADDMTLRELTDEEMTAVAGDKRILAIQQARVAALKSERAPGQHTKDFLAQELEKLVLPIMAAKAREGYYHDFLSPLSFPEMQLLDDLNDAAKLARSFNNMTQFNAIMELRKRHLNGDFDASPEESEEWSKSEEGREAFQRLIKGD